jgi:hypothetical protein
VLAVSEQAREAGVRRLVFCHIWKTEIRALDAGLHPPFGEFGVEGRTYHVARS